MNVRHALALRPLAPRPRPCPAPQPIQGSINSAFGVRECMGSKRGARAGYSRLQPVTAIVAAIFQQNQRLKQSGYKLQRQEGLSHARARAHTRETVTV
ncbi:hypothetical protein ACVWW6_005538 [Bradyrhizobium sp. USDA 3311]